MRNKKPALGGLILFRMTCYSHRALAAFLAISDRSSGVNLSALALPPLNPPLRLSAFLPVNGCGFVASQVAICATLKAICEKSFLLFVVMRL